MSKARPLACGHPSRRSAFGLAPEDEDGVCGCAGVPCNTLGPHPEEPERSEGVSKDGANLSPDGVACDPRYSAEKAGRPEGESNAVLASCLRHGRGRRSCVCAERKP